MAGYKLKIFFTLNFFIIILDQVSKWYIHKNYRLGETMDVISGFFNITYVRNYGAAFGFLNSSPETFRKLFFLIFPVLAMIFVIFLIKALKKSENLELFCYSLIFAGALGNYLDRLNYGYVVDFLDFHYKAVYHYPAFNVADMSIVTGVAALILGPLIFKKA